LISNKSTDLPTGLKGGMTGSTVNRDIHYRYKCFVVVFFPMVNEDISENL
jgi:hypothetical protein